MAMQDLCWGYLIVCHGSPTWLYQAKILKSYTTYEFKHMFLYFLNTCHTNNMCIYTELSSCKTQGHADNTYMY